MIVIGCDPGLTGALTFLDHHGAVTIEDLPVMPIPGIGPKTTIRVEIDACALRDLFLARVPIDETATVFVEHVSALGLPGAQAAASLAASKAVVIAVARLLRYDVHRVHPVTWKRSYGIKEPGTGVKSPDGKHQALALARSFYGMHRLERVKDHNRAESALIARWGARNFV